MPLRLLVIDRPALVRSLKTRRTELVADGPTIDELADAARRATCGGSR